MKNIINAFVYALIFVAIQAMAGIVVHFIWQQVVGGTDITVMELVATIAVFSLLTIIIFLSARWAEISPNWLLTKQWDVMMWAVLAALGMVIPMTWLQENMPELPNWIENEQEQLLSKILHRCHTPSSQDFCWGGCIGVPALSSQVWHTTGRITLLPISSSVPIQIRT